jgi:hypothetical protein
LKALQKAFIRVKTGVQGIPAFLLLSREKVGMRGK